MPSFVYVKALDAPRLRTQGDEGVAGVRNPVAGRVDQVAGAIDELVLDEDPVLLRAGPIQVERGVVELTRGREVQVVGAEPGAPRQRVALAEEELPVTEEVGLPVGAEEEATQIARGRVEHADEVGLAESGRVEVPWTVQPRAARDGAGLANEAERRLVDPNTAVAEAPR